jgi:hypothetical protein
MMALARTASRRARASCPPAEGGPDAGATGTRREWRHYRLLAVVLLVILKGANTQSAGDGLVLMDQAQAHP